MAKAKLYNQDGQEKGSVALNAAVFEVPVKKELVKQAIDAYFAVKRSNLAHTKDRSEVRGGGKKPWRQKGTGRARHGSTRSPIWIGGGITFGPRKEQNFSVRLNKKMKRKALSMVLSDRANDNLVLVLESFENKEAKTKKVAEFLKKINIDSALVITETAEVSMQRAIKNLPKVKVVPTNSVNVYDALRYKNIIFMKTALSKFEELMIA